jgi:hypothetical protein
MRNVFESGDLSADEFPPQNILEAEGIP